MTIQEQYTERLKEMVRAKYRHDITTEEECLQLGDEIAEECGTRVDGDALIDLFLPTRETTSPRPTTLTALSQYVGYEGWTEFCTSRDIRPSEDTELIPATHRWGVIILTIVAIVVVIIATTMLLLGNRKAEQGTNTTISKGVESRFRSVEERWVAATTEQCNTLREYLVDEDEQSLNEYYRGIEDYLQTIEERIAEDLVEYCQSECIAYTDDTIARNTSHIADKCRRMCARDDRE